MRTTNRNLFSLQLVAAALFGGVASGQRAIEGQPYGEPSESFVGGSASLGLYLMRVADGQTALRLDGGTPGDPAIIVFSADQDDSPVPGGGTRLVGPIAGMASGTFDAQGTFLQILTDARFEGAGDELFVQGLQPANHFSGFEFSGGLQLTRYEEPIVPPEGMPQLPEEVFVEEFGGLMRAGHMETALDLALNSKGDSIVREIAGELQVPVFPSVTAGGEASVKAGVL